MKDLKLIEASLDVFKKMRGTKKGFLFDDRGVTYFYDHKSCILDGCRMAFSCLDKKMYYYHGAEFTEPVFIYFYANKIVVVTSENEYCYPINETQSNFRLILLFSIFLVEGEMLRGVLYGDAEKSAHIYFAYIADEELGYLLEELLFKDLSNKDIFQKEIESSNNKMLNLLNKIYNK